MSCFRPSKIEEKIAYEIFRSCRLCGAGAGYKMPIVQNVDLDGAVPLTLKIRECVQIEVYQDDKMPPLICELCVDKVNDFYEFSEMCKQTNMKTRLRLGLPPQTIPKGAPNAGDCILGVTETLFSNEDSNEPIINHNQAKQKLKKETSDKVKIKSSENSGSAKSSSDNKRATHIQHQISNILTSRNRNSKDQKNKQYKKKSSEPLKSILKKEKIKEDEIVTPKSKRASPLGKRKERELRSDFPVKRVKIEVSPSTSKSFKFRSPPRLRAKSPPRSRTKPLPRCKSPQQHVCRFCKRGFDLKRSLSNHMRSHLNQTMISKNKMPPVAESRSKDRSEQIQAKDKEESKQDKEYLSYGNLCEHQITCTRKKNKGIINPKLFSKCRPLQIRVARCDPWLNRKYTSEMTQAFGLDKNCIYPYLKIKTEPKTGTDGMVRIDDEIKQVIDNTDYVHWDSDSSTDKNVLSLSKLSLKTLFSPRYPGRVRKKKIEVKTELNKTLLNTNLDTIDSFDDVHDLERINDNFDSLFSDDYQKILPDVDNTNKEEKNTSLNKEVNSNHKEVNSSIENDSTNQLNSNKKEENEITERQEKSKMEHKHVTNGISEDIQILKGNNEGMKDIEKDITSPASIFKDIEISDAKSEEKTDESITGNDLLDKKNTESGGSMELDASVLENNKEELEIYNSNRGEAEKAEDHSETNNTNSEKTEITDNVAKHIMKVILGKVKDNEMSHLVNGDDIMDDQRLMDELDAQIGEDIMEQNMSLDDFSEDVEF